MQGCILVILFSNFYWTRRTYVLVGRQLDKFGRLPQMENPWIGGSIDVTK